MKKFSAVSLAVLYRQLAVVYASGVNLERALLCLSGQGHQPLHLSLRLARNRLCTGYPFWRALRDSGPFPDLHIRFIRLGENSGEMDSILKALAEFQERYCQLQARLKAALTYPLVMLAVCLLVLLILPGILFTPVFEFLKSSGVELPWMSRMVLGLLGLLSDPRTWSALGLLLMLSLPKLRRSWENLSRDRLEEAVLALPGLGCFWAQLATVRFLRCLQPAVKSGAPLLTGFDMAADCSGSPRLHRQVGELIQSVREGGSMVQGLRRLELIPRVYRQTLEIGFETGRLERPLNSVAEIAELELETRIEVLLNLLEPLVMLAVGLLVGVVIIATMSPMVELIRSIT